MMELENERLKQNVLIQNRENMEMSGVEEVNSFDENEITAFTTLGFVVIKGSDLHIQKFNTNTKELSIIGKIDELKYKNNQKQESKNFLSRLFR